MVMGADGGEDHPQTQRDGRHPFGGRLPGIPVVMWAEDVAIGLHQFDEFPRSLPLVSPEAVGNEGRHHSQRRRIILIAVDRNAQVPRQAGGGKTRALLAQWFSAERDEVDALLPPGWS